MKNALLFIVLSATTSLFAQQFELVADINQSETFAHSSDPRDMAVFNGDLYLSARGPYVGQELHRFNGTTAELVADINPEGQQAYPIKYEVQHDRLYFYAYDEAGSAATYHLYSLDADDNVIEITDCLFDINDSDNLATFPKLQAFNDLLLFVKFNESEDTWELWKYDGNNAPEMVYSAWIGYANFPNISAQAVLNDTFYFYHNGIYAYDGVNPPVLQPNTQAFSGGVVTLFPYDGALYYSAQTPNSGGELWKYDGVNAPVLAYDIDPTPQTGGLNFPLQAAIYDGEMYFQARNDADGGRELMRFDGENLSIYDINPNGSSSPADFAVYGDKLYFCAVNGINGRELYSFDGGAPALVNDLVPGEAGGFASNLTVYNDALFFSANANEVGAELYKYDGNNVELAANIYNINVGSGPQWLTKFGDEVFFSANGPMGVELYKTDGSVVAVEADLNPGTDDFGNPNHSYPQQLTVLNDKLYFQANINNNQTLWSYDGQSPDAQESLDVSLTNGFEWNGVIYYAGFDTEHGSELWTYDGSTSEMLLDINPGQVPSNPGMFIVFEDKLIFRASTQGEGSEMWQYDGINPPTLIADINANVGEGSYPSSYAIYNDKLYFAADPGNLIGNELMVYDGINPPTLVADLQLGSSDGYGNGVNPTELTVFGDQLFFIGNSDLTTYAKDLFMYDGVNEPAQFTDYDPESQNGQFFGWTMINGKAYFWLDTNEGLGFELYSFDGVSQPQLVAEQQTGEESSKPSLVRGMVELDGYLYLAVNDGSTGGNFGQGELYRVQLCEAISAVATVSGAELSAEGGFDGYQWYDANGAIEGATSANYTATANGEFYCVVSDADNCSGTTNTVEVTVLSISEPDLATIKLYPNPTTGAIFIPSGISYDSIILYSADGRLVKTYKNEEIDLSAFDNGMYLLEITVGQHSHTQRVLKY